MTEFNKKHESYSDLSKHGQLHIKPKLHYVTVLHDVFLALQPQFPSSLSLLLTTKFNQVIELSLIHISEPTRPY